LETNIYIALGVSEKIFNNTMMQGKKQSNEKSREKLAHLGGQLAMSCGPSALVKFPSGPHNSTKYVVTLGPAVVVGKLW
jgi:hypothetical protein